MSSFPRLKIRLLTNFSDALEASVVYPFGTGLIGGIYDWNIGTVPQTQLNGATRALPVGHVVGGGTVINGMVWNRGTVDDFDAWDSLQGGNSGWTWNDLLPYFIRVRFDDYRYTPATNNLQSETYTPKTYAGQNPQPVTYDASVHGTGSDNHPSKVRSGILTIPVAPYKLATQTTTGRNQVRNFPH